MDGESAPAFRFNFGKEEAEQVQEEQGPPEYDEPAEELVYRPEPVRMLLSWVCAQRQDLPLTQLTCPSALCRRACPSSQSQWK